PNLAVLTGKLYPDYVRAINIWISKLAGSIPSDLTSTKRWTSPFYKATIAKLPDAVRTQQGMSRLLGAASNETDAFIHALRITSVVSSYKAEAIILKKLDRMDNASLEVIDEDVYNLLREEKSRQINSIELIASENFVPRAILEALGSCATNKYAEGYPGRRYYGGNEVIDKIETLAQTRALEAYDLCEDKWGVNVQSLSGSPANIAVFTALVRPGGRIMGQALKDGGHLTHGYYTPNKKINASSLFFESLPYHIDPATGLIDYDELEKNAKIYQPKIIIAGISAYSRNLDYRRFRAIADQCKSILMADMAHVSGLVAHNLVTNPFEYCDIVTTTTHKTMRGPRGALIFFKKDFVAPYDKTLNVEHAINEAVFPCLQGGPHENNIAGIAVALKILKSPAFEQYAKQVIANSQQLAETLCSLGYKLVTGGTENHMVLIDLNPQKIDGSMAERILECISIAVNKNTIASDKSVLRPHGLRLGSAAMTSRGMGVKEFEKIANFIHQALTIAIRVVKFEYFEKTDETLAMKFEDMLKHPAVSEQLSQLKTKVVEMCSVFPMPGNDLF
ncbi:hypothetical protein GJ496_002348, partial [Pomphorhynchus laevis]